MVDPHAWSRATSETSGPSATASEELRLNYGPGYRIYYLRHQDQLIVILAEADKSSQPADITTAHEIAAHWRRTQGEQQ